MVDVWLLVAGSVAGFKDELTVSLECSVVVVLYSNIRFAIERVNVDDSNDDLDSLDGGECLDN